MPTIRARTELDNKPFKNGVRGMSKSVSGFKQQLSKVGGLMAGAFGVTALAGLSRKTLQFGSTLSDLASQAGLTTDEYQALEIASIRAGVTSDKIRTAMSKLNVVIGQAKSGMKTYVDLFNRAGITMEQLQRSSPAEVFELLARSITKAERGSSEFGAVLELLGTRSAAQLTEVFQELSEVGFGGLISQAKEAGQLLDKELIQRLDELEDSLQLTQRQMLVEFAPALEAMAGAAKHAGRILAESFRQAKAGVEEKGVKTLFNPLAQFKRAQEALRMAAERAVADELAAGAAANKKRRAQEAKDNEQSLNNELTAITDGEKKKAAARAKSHADKSQKARDKLADVQSGKGISVDKTVADRLARIGGFSGGQVSPEARFAERALKINQNMLVVMKDIRRDMAARAEAQYQ